MDQVGAEHKHGHCHKAKIADQQTRETGRMSASNPALGPIREILLLKRRWSPTGDFKGQQLVLSTLS